MPSLDDLEELRLSLGQIVTKSRTFQLSDLTYLLQMAMLEIIERQQFEMDRLEQGGFSQNTEKAGAQPPPFS